MSHTQTRGPRLSMESARSSEAGSGVQQIVKSIYAGPVPRSTLELVHMRASQINGCNACIAAGITTAQNTGVSLEQLVALPAWRESDRFDDAQRAALALAEAMTRQADHPDVVTDELWAQVAEHYDDAGLSALVSMIALSNFFNRINTTLRVQPGEWG